MEKIIYALWASDGESRDSFNARLLTSLPEAQRAGLRPFALLHG